MPKRNLHRFLYLPPPLAVHIPGNTRRSSVISRKVYNFLHINSSYNTRNGCVGTWLCLLVCLMAFNATFNNISVISWRSVNLWRNPEKTTDLSKITDKIRFLYFILMILLVQLSMFTADRNDGSKINHGLKWYHVTMRRNFLFFFIKLIK